MGYKDSKTFNGKKYVFLYYAHTKKEAQDAAKRERGRGWKIRIVPTKIGQKLYYDLYGRNKP